MRASNTVSAPICTVWPSTVSWAVPALRLRVRADTGPTKARWVRTALATARLLPSTARLIGPPVTCTTMPRARVLAASVWPSSPCTRACVSSKCTPLTMIEP